MTPSMGRLLGAFFGGQGGEEEDRKQQLYKYLRVFAKTPDSPAHAGNYVIINVVNIIGTYGAHAAAVTMVLPFDIGSLIR